MTHTMRLNARPFEMIESGKKTVEMRLYDEKRRAISIGDEIIFVHRDDPSRRLSATATALHLFPSFEELYRALPLTACGYTDAELTTASPDDMCAYYSREEQERYGVVGIEVRLL